MSEVSKDIVRKIKALLAKARGTENEHEAAMFAAKAAELLQAHNLQEHELGHDEVQEPIGKSSIVSPDTNGWRRSIYRETARLYFGRIYIADEIHDGRLRKVVYFVGRPHNVEIAISMSQYLEKTTLRLAREYSPLRRERLQFEKGCGLRLGARIAEMADLAMKPSAGLIGTASGLPALYKTELQLVTDEVNRICEGGKKSYARHRSGGSAMAAGQRAAEGVHLGGQIGGASAGRLLGSR